MNRISITVLALAIALITWDTSAGTTTRSTINTFDRTESSPGATWAQTGDTTPGYTGRCTASTNAWEVSETTATTEFSRFDSGTGGTTARTPSTVWADTTVDQTSGYLTENTDTGSLTNRTVWLSTGQS